MQELNKFTRIGYVVEGVWLWRISGGIHRRDDGNVISGSKEKECDAVDKYMDA